MGCFLACFGVSKKRKLQRLGSKVTAGDQIHVSYEPLNPITEGSKFRDKPREQSRFKIRKKVSFNPNVQAYEPIPDNHFFLETDEEVKTHRNSQKNRDESVSASLSERESISLNLGSYPKNYRYWNCTDGYDEENDLAYEESDSDDDDYDEHGSNANNDEQSTCEEGFSGQDCHLTMRLQERNLTQLPVEKTKHNELDALESKTNGLHKDQNVHSVLKPVDNLSQWRIAKAKLATTKQQLEKDTHEPEESSVPIRSEPNLIPSPFRLGLNPIPSKHLMKEITVDASLSSWLA